MKNSKSLLEERAINVEKMESLVDLCKVEDREMTSEEQVDFDSLNEKVYNFGIDGHNFWIQYLRHLEIMKYKLLQFILTMEHLDYAIVLLDQGM